MKIFPFLFCIAIFFSPVTKAQDNASAPGEKQTSEDYIIKKDSTKVFGKVVDKKGKIFLDGQPYEYTELLSFKHGREVNDVFGKKVYYVFVPGKLTAYTIWENYGSSGIDRGFFRKGNGDLIRYTTHNLRDLIQDNPKALALFDESFPKVSDKAPLDFAFAKMKRIVRAYNGIEVQD